MSFLAATVADPSETEFILRRAAQFAALSGGIAAIIVAQGLFELLTFDTQLLSPSFRPATEPIGPKTHLSR
jgi:hypothetical protein